MPQAETQSPGPEAKPEVFVYPASLDDSFIQSSRFRRLGCWPLLCAPCVAFGVFIGLKGGPNSWLGFAFAGGIVALACAFEYSFHRFARRTLDLSSGSISFDGRVLRQHDPSGVPVGTIETSRKFSTRSWSVGGNYVITIHQDGQRLVYTSDVDRAKDISARILRIGEPDESSS